jgi:hypothetical protein
MSDRLPQRPSASARHAPFTPSQVHARQLVIVCVEQARASLDALAAIVYDGEHIAAARARDFIGDVERWMSHARSHTTRFDPIEEEGEPVHHLSHGTGTLCGVDHSARGEPRHAIGLVARVTCPSCLALLEREG